MLRRKRHIIVSVIGVDNQAIEQFGKPITKARKKRKREELFQLSFAFSLNSRFRD
jgi:hypothetical protein